MTYQAFAIPAVGQWAKGIAKLEEARGHPGPVSSNRVTGEGCGRPSTITQHKSFFLAPVMCPC